jgi:hypothetical protein
MKLKINELAPKTNFLPTKCRRDSKLLMSNLLQREAEKVDGCHKAALLLVSSFHEE